MEITTEELTKKIANGEKLIVDFHAKWCSPCKMMKPMFGLVYNEIYLYVWIIAIYNVFFFVGFCPKFTN